MENVIPMEVELSAALWFVDVVCFASLIVLISRRSCNRSGIYSSLMIRKKFFEKVKMKIDFTGRGCAIFSKILEIPRSLDYLPTSRSWLIWYKILTYNISVILWIFWLLFEKSKWNQFCIWGRGGGYLSMYNLNL